jgi:hypothetical protein
MDGSHGPYDPCRYAQVFDHCHPWLAFHCYHSQAHYALEPGLHNAVQLFDWKDLCQKDMGGGLWNLNASSSILTAWIQAERTFVETLRKVGDPHGKLLLEHYGPALPHFDNLTYEDILSWTQWDEGHNTVGHTL